MHLPTHDQRAAVAATSLLAHACATTVLVLLPAHLVLDLGRGPAACAALAGVAGTVSALATPIGRYLTSRCPGRLVIVGPASVAAALAPVVLASCTGLARVVGALVLGAAALATGSPAWRSLAEASSATGAARRGAWSGRLAGLAVALAASTRPVRLAPGIRIGAFLGLAALLVLAVSVEDNRTPLTPRRSVTLTRWRRACTVAEVRRAAAIGAASAVTVVGGTVGAMAALGPGQDPTLVVGAVALGWLGYAGVEQVLGTRAANAVTDELRLSARAVVETAALLGAATAALVAAMCVRILA